MVKVITTDTYKKGCTLFLMSNIFFKQCPLFCLNTLFYYILFLIIKHIKIKRKYEIHFLVRCPKLIISKYFLLQLIRNNYWFIMIMYWHIKKKYRQYEYKINLTLIFMESAINLNCRIMNFYSNYFNCFGSSYNL